MRCIDLPGYNLILNKPPKLKDEDCLPITAFRGFMEAVDDEGNRVAVEYILTAWQPNKEDLESLNNGLPVFIRTLGHDFAPIAVWTINEEEKPND